MAQLFCQFLRLLNYAIFCVFFMNKSCLFVNLHKAIADCPVHCAVRDRCNPVFFHHFPESAQIPASVKYSCTEVTAFAPSATAVTRL